MNFYAQLQFRLETSLLLQSQMIALICSAVDKADLWALKGSTIEFWHNPDCGGAARITLPAGISQDMRLAIASLAHQLHLRSGIGLLFAASPANLWRLSIQPDGRWIFEPLEEVLR